jgi:hypothetical protein
MKRLPLTSVPLTSGFRRKTAMLLLYMVFATGFQTAAAASHASVRGNDSRITDQLPIAEYDMSSRRQLDRATPREAGDGETANDATTKPPFATGADGVNESSTNKRENDLVIFVLLYMGIALCCVMPSVCAYRLRRQRRRQAESMTNPASTESHIVQMESTMGLAQGTLSRKLQNHVAKLARTARIKRALEQTSIHIAAANLVDGTGKLADESDPKKSFVDLELASTPTTINGLQQSEVLVQLCQPRNHPSWKATSTGVGSRSSSNLPARINV